MYLVFNMLSFFFLCFVLCGDPLDQNTTKRKIKESVAINRAKKASCASRLMNKDSGLELSNIWLDLL